MTVEDVLDDPDLLQECKSNNGKLISYLQQIHVLQRLLDHVVGAAETEDIPANEPEEKIGFKYPFVASEVLSSEIPEVSLVLFQHANDLLVPFWDKFLASDMEQAKQPLPLYAHPLTSSSYGSSVKEDGGEGTTDDTEKHKYSACTHGPGFTILAGYWAKVNMMLLERHPQEFLAFVKTMPFAVERLVNHFDTPAIVDVLFRLIQCEDSVPDAGIIEWLSEHDLISRIVGLFSPYASPELHTAASEFLKAIISLSAPSPSSLNQITMQETFGGPGEMLLGAGGVNNLLVRELASEESVNKLVSFMLEYDSGAHMSCTEWASSSGGFDSTLQPLNELETEDLAIEEEEDDEDVWTLRRAMTNRQNRQMSVSQSFSKGAPNHRDSTATVRPAMLRRASSVRSVLAPSSIASSFINCASVCIELIRKNNSDYFEQHLFHTLRNYLVLRQQELSGHRRQKMVEAKTSEEPNGDNKPELSLDDLPFDEDADMEGMEEAMAEVAEKMGIVHLGPLLKALADKIPDLQAKMRSPPPPRATVMTTLGPIEPLTQIRYCIAELYAELLHCSNMALLNREKHSGPKYSPSGTLMGGMDGLQALARTLQGEDVLSPPMPAADMSASGEWGPGPGEELGNLDSPLADHSEPQVSSNEQSSAGTGRESAASSSSSEQDESENNDAESIASALSSLSLADLTSHFSSRPHSLAGESDYHIVGNFLKKQFLSYEVIPTLIELFLHYPWNNFLHNVVYDILQQLFNGDMDTPINRTLTISTFRQGCLVDAILEGSRRNQESSRQPRLIRLGYMGHLNLIAEEVIKLLERYPSEIASDLQEFFHQPDWDDFVNEELRVSRAKESLPLAGGRPTSEAAMQNWSSLDSDEWYSDNEGSNTFARYLSSQMRSDNGNDDSENDMLAHLSNIGDRPEAEDEWGPFTDPPAMQSTFEFTNTGTGVVETRQENLTPADWAAEFRRGGMSDMPTDSVLDDSDSDDTGAGSGREDRDAGNESDENANDDSPYVDLHKPASLRQRAESFDRIRAERDPTEAGLETEDWPSASAAKHVRASSTGGEDRAALIAEGLLPPDVTTNEEGLLTRTLADGTTVTAPLDDAELELAQSESAIEDD